MVSTAGPLIGIIEPIWLLYEDEIRSMERVHLGLMLRSNRPAAPLGADDSAVLVSILKDGRKVGAVQGVLDGKFAAPGITDPEAAVEVDDSSRLGLRQTHVMSPELEVSSDELRHGAAGDRESMHRGRVPFGSTLGRVANQGEGGPL